MRSFSQGCEHLRELGFNPPVIVDVGVAWGTPDLYAAWPDSFLYLIEPVEFFHSGLERLLEKRAGVLVKAAAGEVEATSRITVRNSSLGLAGASLTSARRTSSPEDEWVDFEFRVDRLDRLVDVAAIPAGSLLKTDCQGFDHAVLLGASGLLPSIEVLIVEAHVFRYPGFESNSLPSLISIAEKSGFFLYDLLSPEYRKHDAALSQVDAVFVRQDSALLRFKGY